MTLLKVTAQELQVDTPLAFAVCSASGKLLLNEGCSDRSDSQRDRILASGGYRYKESTVGTVPERKAPQAVLLSTVNHAISYRVDENVVSTTTQTLPKTVESMQVTLIGQKHEPFRTEYVGSVASRTLVLAACDGQDLPEVGARLDCRALKGRRIYRFNSTAIGRSETLVKVMYLTIPNSVETHIVRKHVRVTTELQGRLIRNDCIAAGFDVTLVNASLGALP